MRSTADKPVKLLILLGDTCFTKVYGLLQTDKKMRTGANVVYTRQTCIEMMVSVM